MSLITYTLLPGTSWSMLASSGIIGY